MFRVLSAITLLFLATVALAQSESSIPGWDEQSNSFGDSIDDGAADVGEAAGEVVGMVTEIGENAFQIATTIGDSVVTLGADSLQGLENVMDALGAGFEEDRNGSPSPNGALGIQPWSISYPLIATCAAVVGGVVVGAFAVL